MPSRRELLVTGSVRHRRAAGAGPAKMTRVEVHSDPDVDFSAFKTYGWKDPVSAAKSHEVHMSIIWYVERGLEKKGLKKIQDDDPAMPDVFVRYYAKARAASRGPRPPSDMLPGGPENLTTSFDFHKAAAGTLILEIQRAIRQQGGLARRSRAFSVDSKRVDAEVSRAVEILFQEVPAEIGPGARTRPRPGPAARRTRVSRRAR